MRPLPYSGPMGRGPDVLRRAALLAVGALSLHQLRYLAGYGGNAGDAAAAHGHGYLSWVAVAAVGLVVAAGCAFVLALAGARRARGSEAAPAGFARAWLAASAALAVIYSVQELAEGWLAHGHPGGAAALLGHGGWTAYALALAIGALVALALRGARRAVVLAARGRRIGRLVLPRTMPVPAASAAPLLPRPRLVSLTLAGRAPPAASG